MIRYPLFWLAGTLLLGVLLWVGRPLWQAIGTTVKTGWDRAVQGPPVPSSPEPRRWAGSLPRRGLLLKDGVTVTDRPDGRPVETIGRRMFVDLYDTWPIDADQPTHYRIGNRRPFGWVPAPVVIPWDTRLVLLVAATTPDAGSNPEPVPLAAPVLAWEPGRIRLAFWKPDHPWSEVLETGWVDWNESLSPGVFLSRPELLEALRRLHQGDPPRTVRLRAITGRLLERDAAPAEDDAVAEALPAWCRYPPRDPKEASAQLSRLNEGWNTEAAWSGLEFATVPLSALP